MHFRFSCILAFAILVATVACNKSTTFGGDILDDQTLNTIFTDTVQVNMRVLPEDSVLTSDPNSIAPFLLCGLIDDPILGQSEATVYAGLQITSLNNDFKTTKLDSVVLYLGVDANGVYGDTNKIHEIQVTELDAHPVNGKRYFSDTSIAVSNNVLGTAMWLPTPRTGRSIVDTTSAVRDSAFGAYFSMRLSDDFGKRILGMDSLTLANDTLFWDKVKGIQIKSKTAGAMLGLNLNDRTFSRITLYYRKDTANAPQRVSNIQFVGENKFVHFQTTPSAYVSQRVGNVLTDDVLPLQGLASTRIEVEIPHMKAPDKAKWSINTAEIVLYGANVPGDNLSKYDLAKQMTATVSVGDTTYAVLSDVAYSLNTTGDGFALFGGNPFESVEQGTTVMKYKLSIPSFLQDVILGNQKPKFYINLFPTARVASRSLLHSPGVTSPYRARLNLRYTVLD
jgi:Domain of unknown function (DUF4270)